MSRILDAALDAMLLPTSSPEVIAEIGRMAEEKDEPDEDYGPVQSEAAARVKALRERIVQAKMEAKFGGESRGP